MQEVVEVVFVELQRSTIWTFASIAISVPVLNMQECGLRSKGC